MKVDGESVSLILILCHALSKNVTSLHTCLSYCKERSALRFYMTLLGCHNYRIIFLSHRALSVNGITCRYMESLRRGSRGAGQEGHGQPVVRRCPY